VASARVRKLSRDLHRRRVHARVRTKVSGTTERPRLCVYRSLGHIYAQVIDDRTGKTLVSASSVDKETKKNLKGGGNVAAAKVIGKVRPRRVQVPRPRQGARRRGAGSGVTVLSLCRSKFCETV
jgi:large subunit ribosomal protein L18